MGQVTLNRPGRHTIYNSLAAIAVGLELEIDFSTIAMALQGFQGVERRIEVKGDAGGVLVVDDYGHHPTEIRATLDAVREAWPEKRLVVAFQPHRYSRTQGLFDEFVTAFHRADVLVLTDIYPASEAPIAGITAQVLQEAIQKHGQRNTFYIPGLIESPSELLPLLQKNDLLLTLGAGNIVRTGEQMLHLIAEKSNKD